MDSIRPRIKRPRRQDVTLRRTLHGNPFAHHQPLTFRTDTAELNVNTVHIFAHRDDERYRYGGVETVAISFVTGTGSVNVLMPQKLAEQMSDGIRRSFSSQHS